MQRFSILRYMSVGMAIGLFAALSSPVNAQILDRLRNRDSRTQSEWQPVERYYPPGPIQEGRVFRGGTEVRRGTEYRGDAEFRSDDRNQTRQVTNARRGTILIGSTVTLDGGRSMGRVEDFVIGETGCVDFLVVSVSGIRGMSGRLAVLPFAIAEPDFRRRIVYVNWSEEDIRSGPIFFTSNNWPDFNDSRRTDEIFAFFEVDSRSAHSGRSYRNPSEMDERRSDRRSSRERDSDREDESSDRRQDSSRRVDSERSNRDRDSYDTRDHDRSSQRSRSRDSDEDNGDRSNRSSRSDDSSDRNGKTRDRDSDDDSNSSDRNRNSKRDLPD